MSTQAVIIFKPLQTIKTQTKKTNIKINHLCQKRTSMLLYPLLKYLLLNINGQ